MKIYLVRHGQSQWQLEPSENWDTLLTELGHEQSRRMGRWLADRPKVEETGRIEIASLCTSPLQRARETAAPIAEALDLPLSIVRELGEADFHVSEHLPAAGGPLHPFPDFEPSAVYAAFKAQARAALQGLVEKAEAAGGPVLAVTHGGLVKTLLRLVVGSDNVCFRLCNTGLNTIEWKRGRWHLVHLNLCEHLPIELRTW